MTSIADRHFILISFLLGLFAAPASMFAATVTNQTAETARPARAATLTQSNYAHADWLADAAFCRHLLHACSARLPARLALHRLLGRVEQAPGVADFGREETAMRPRPAN